MINRLFVALAVVCAVVVLTACGGGSPQSRPTSPTTLAATPTPLLTIRTFEGDWTADSTTDVSGSAPPTSARTGSCSLVEFHVARSTDAGTAVIVFAATCARVRIRAEGTGTITGDTLYWKAEGAVRLENGNSCRFRFTEGNKATPAGEGLIKVTYNGTVCDTPVSGTEIVRRR